jgi:uncharacterized membrane protein
MSWDWHRGLTLIFSLFAAITGGISIGYYNKIRLNPSQCSELSSTQILAGLWLNIILTILAGLLFIWTLLETESKKPGIQDTIVQTQKNTINHEPESTNILPGPYYQYNATNN